MRKVVNFRPIVFAALCSLTGVAAAYFLVLNNYLSFIVLSAIFIILITLFIIKSGGKYRRKISIALLLTFIALFFGFNFYLKVSAFNKADLKTQRLLITGTISEKVGTENGERITLKDNSAKGTFNGQLKYKVLVYVDGETEYDVGDVVYFYGVVYDNDYIYEDNFQAYKIADGIKYHSFTKNTDVIKSGENKTAFDLIRLKLRDALKSGLSENEFSVAYALLLGDSDYIDDAIITNFRSAGVAHIFAVSGLHIGFLATILYFVLKKLRINGVISVIICAILLIFYSGVCGFSSSSVRAVITSVVFLLTTVFGKKYDMLSSTSIAGLIILLVSPAQLFCVGFQLSFGVVLSIILFSGKFAKLVPVKNDGISNLVGGVIAAQLVSVPICLYAFNEVSLIAVIANLLFIPAVGVIYCALFVVSVAVVITGLNFLFLPINYILAGVIFLIKAFDYTVLTVGGITLGGFSLFYYSVLLLCSDVINIKKALRVFLFCAFSTVFVCGTTIVNVNETKGERYYVIGDRDICATLFISKEENTLIISNLKTNFLLKRIDRCLKKSYNKNIDRVIIANSTQSLPVDQILAKLYSYYGIKRAVLTDGVAENERQALSKTFFNIDIKYLADGDPLRGNNATFSFSYDGYAVKYFNGQKSVIIFSGLNKGVMSKEGETEYDELIATDYIEILKSRFKFKKLIAYNSKNYVNAYSRGNYLVKIS